MLVMALSSVWLPIYLLTAIGLTPGGSSAVHIYTQTNTQNNIMKQNTQNGTYVTIRIPILLLLPLALQPTVGFDLSNNVLPFFSYLPPTLSFFSLPALEDLFILHLSIVSWVFPFFSTLPVLE